MSFIWEVLLLLLGVAIAGYTALLLYAHGFNAIVLIVPLMLVCLTVAFFGHLTGVSGLQFFFVFFSQWLWMIIGFAIGLLANLVGRRITHALDLGHKMEREHKWETTSVALFMSFVNGVGAVALHAETVQDRAEKMIYGDLILFLVIVFTKVLIKKLTGKKPYYEELGETALADVKWWWEHRAEQLLRTYERS